MSRHLNSLATKRACVKSFSPDNRLENYLSQDELKHLLTALESWKNRPVARILLLAAATGMRIGEALFISDRTVGVHVSNLMGKLGAANRAEAALIADRHGLIEPHG